MSGPEIAWTLAATTAVAALLSGGLIWLLRPLLVRHALARPNARSSHAAPTPQGGGIAVMAATVAAASLAVLVWYGTRGLVALAPATAAVLALAVLGGIDDVRPLPAGLRLLVQAACVTALLVVADPPRVLPGALPAAFERSALILAGVWWVNLVNFMDGIDWITCAAIVPLAGAIALFGLNGVVEPRAAIVAAALVGGLLGFAPTNRPVARLFLGDVGSLPIGLVTGGLLVALASSGALAAALLLPLYYVADATVTLALRLVRGERVWEAHRSHFYQRALGNGFSVLAVDAVVFTLNVALAGLAVATLAWPGPWPALAALTSGAVLVAVVLWSFDRPRLKDRPPS